MKTSGQLKVKQVDQLCSLCGAKPAHSKGLCGTCYGRRRAEVRRLAPTLPIVCSACGDAKVGRTTNGQCHSCYNKAQYMFAPGTDTTGGVTCTGCSKLVPRFWARTLCKTCTDKAYRSGERVQRVVLAGGACQDCKKSFVKLTAKGICSSCSSHRRYLANRERHLALGRQWKTNNKAKKTEKGKEWYANNEEYLRDKRRTDYESNPEKYERYRAMIHPLKQRDYNLKSKYADLIVDYRARHPELFVTPHPSSEHGPFIECFMVMLETQDGKCANPGCSTRHTDKKPLVVDHCHAGGGIRALLCSVCNLTFGHLGEDAARIAGLLAYKETHSAGATKAVAG